MTREELEKRLNEAERKNLSLIDEIKCLKEQLANVETEPEIPDFPFFNPIGEETWHINNVLEVATPSRTGGHVCDFNYFHTQDYAKEFSRKCKMLAMMLHCKWYLCRDFKGDYSCSNDKWVVYHGGIDNEFAVASLVRCEYGLVSFDTMENAQKCADWLNTHWAE